MHACHMLGMYLLSEQIENIVLAFPVWLCDAVLQAVMQRKVDFTLSSFEVF